MDPFDACAPALRVQVTACLAEVEERLQGAVGSSSPLVDASGSHLVVAGGKRLRPLVTLLAAAAVAPAAPAAPASPGVIAGASAVELLHLSTLYHDDVIDHAATRRGVASANARWGTRIAVAAGDRLTALALLEAADAGPQVPGILARTYARLVDGERLETAVSGRLDAGTSTYLAVVDGKTASLVAAAASVGATAVGAASWQRDAVAAWGRDLGRAFQLADDLLDLTGDADQAGKPVGRDLTLGVYTWPVLDALTTPAGARLRTVLAGPPPHPSAAVEEAMAIVRHSGSIERGSAFVTRLLDRADHHLGNLPRTAATAALAGLGRALTPTPAARPLTAVGG